MKVQRTCPLCGKQSVLENIPLSGYQAYMNGALIQNAFPTMSPSDREIMITGTHPKCWDLLFADDSDDCND